MNMNIPEQLAVLVLNLVLYILAELAVALLLVPVDDVHDLLLLIEQKIVPPNSISNNSKMRGNTQPGQQTSSPSKLRTPARQQTSNPSKLRTPARQQTSNPSKLRTPAHFEPQQTSSLPHLQVLAKDVGAEAGRLLYDADLALLLGRHYNPKNVGNVQALEGSLFERLAPQLHEGTGELVLGKGADGLPILGGLDGVHQLGKVLLVVVVLLAGEQLDVGHSATAVQVCLQRFEEFNFFLASQEHHGVLDSELVFTSQDTRTTFVTTRYFHKIHFQKF